MYSIKEEMALLKLLSILLIARTVSTQTHPPLSPSHLHTHRVSVWRKLEEKLLTILKQVMEEKLTSTNVEVSRNRSAYFLQITAFLLHT